MLNLLARVFDFGEAERSGGTFKEVTERGKLLQIAILPVDRQSQ